MRLRAKVTSATGATVHSYGTLIDGVPKSSNVLPTPDWVDISEEENGYFLLRFNSAGEFLTDTWHESLQAAMSQAEFEYRISPAEWVKVEED